MSRMGSPLSTFSTFPTRLITPIAPHSLPPLPLCASVSLCLCVKIPPYPLYILYIVCTVKFISRKDAENAERPPNPVNPV